MRTQGITDQTLDRPDGELKVWVEWTYETSTYGDGSRDEEFTTSAWTYPDDKPVELTSAEETALLAELKETGWLE